MAKISAVINTLNEESNIESCLESVSWCDEIIVVDMYSEDSTDALVRKYTDKIYKHEKVVGFDIARKFAVDKATGDWILLIDADELVPVQLKELLLNVVATDSADVVFIPRKNYIMGDWIRNTGFWPDYQPRFFRSGAIEFTGQVHNFMHIAGGSRTIHLPDDATRAVEHFCYRDAAHFITKLNGYTTIEARQMFDNGKRFSLFRLLAAGFRGFQVRYISQKGFRDGYRGFFLSLMMGWYRTLVYIKLWELHNEKQGGAVDYREAKRAIVSGYGKREE